MDVNGLPLLGARVELWLENEGAHLTPEISLLQLPDTLWRHEISLKGIGETRLSLPDSIFPAVPLQYRIHARLQTNTNEFLSEQLRLRSYGHQHLQAQVKDGILSVLLNQQDSLAPSVTAHIRYFYPQRIVTDTIQLPFSTPYTYAWDRIQVQAEGLETELATQSLEPGLSLETARTVDSVFFRLDNPLRLDFRYQVYAGKGKRKQLLADDHSNDSTFVWSHDAPKKQIYFVNIDYLWGSSVRNLQRDVPLMKKLINVSLEGPRQINPGAGTTYTLTAKDYKGKGIANADLSVLAYNKKIPYSLNPSPKYLGNEAWRPLYRKTGKQGDETIRHREQMYYAQWCNSLGLEKLAYYQFLYPGKEIFKESIPVPDSLTQFAPYLIDNGEPQEVLALYLDGIPVYYSPTQTASPYSIPVAKDKAYTLEIRTRNHLVTLLNQEFKPGHKTILSLSPHCSDTAVTVIKRLPILSEDEASLLNKYIIALEHSANIDYRYLQQGHKLQLLSNPNLYNRQYRNLLAGPFLPGSPLNYVMLNESQEEVTFPMEGGYRYSIQPGLVLGKEHQAVKPGYFYGEEPPFHFNTFAFSPQDIRKQWKAWHAQHSRKKVRYHYPNKTEFGQGSIQLSYVPDSLPRANPTLNHVLVLSKADTSYIQVYPVQQKINKLDKLLQGLPPAAYQLIGFLSDSSYLELKEVPVGAQQTTYLNLALVQPKLADERLEQVRHLLYRDEGYRAVEEQKKLNYMNTMVRVQPSFGPVNIRGQVISATDNLGLPGVTVKIKGTNTGTNTDFDGNFSIACHLGDVLVFAFVGFVTEEITVQDTEFLTAKLFEDVKQLQEVVVTGYSARVQRNNLSASVTDVLQGQVAGVRIRGAASMATDTKPLLIVDGVPYSGTLDSLDPKQVVSTQLLKSEAATALYGSRAAEGAIIITTKKGLNKQQNLAEALQVQGIDNQSQSLRTNFRDYAIWQPRLRTDAQGKASFRARFPDNITAWDTHILAMTENRYTGKLQETLKAVKPLWSTLSLPRFLIQGDSAMILGTTNNFSGDTLEVISEFLEQEKSLQRQRLQVTQSLRDSSWVKAPASDSVQLTYTLNSAKSNTLLDGERRKIPVYRAGISETEGSAFFLKPGETQSLKLPAGENPWQLTAYQPQTIPLREEIQYLLEYPYGCNEQLASRLIGLLAYEVQEPEVKTRRHKHKVNKLIGELTKNQQTNGLWGWWGTSGKELWVTQHVLAALNMAQHAGYSLDVPKQATEESLRWALHVNEDPLQRLSALEALFEADTSRQIYSGLIDSLSQYHVSQQSYKLRLLRLRELADMPWSVDSLLALRNETILGNYYWGNPGATPQDQQLVTTTWAYHLLKKKNAQEALEKTMQYFWELRQQPHWRNTYASAQLLLYAADFPVQPKAQITNLSLQNSTTKKSLPIETDRSQKLTGGKYTLENTGNTPVFLSTHRDHWISSPTSVNKDFALTTFFSDSVLSIGQPFVLTAELEVSKEAQYVMVELPIPAGCSYEDKNKAYGETYREYYRDRVIIYYRKLSPGRYTIKANLVPKFNGSYTLNPAKASLMYFPAIFGRTGLRQINIP